MGLFDRNSDTQTARDIMKRVKTVQDYEALPDEDRQLVEDSLPKIFDELSPAKRKKLKQMQDASEVIEKAIKDVIEYISRDETTPEDIGRFVTNTIGHTTVKVSEIFELLSR